MYFSDCETTFRTSPYNNPEERGSHQLRDGSLKSPSSLCLIPSTVAEICPTLEYIFFGFKGTFHPRIGYEGLEWEWSYIFTLSLTSALHGVGRSTPRSVRFTPRKDIRCPLYRRLGGSGRVRKISPPFGIRTADRPVPS
jgi:hypothetical protein